MKTVVCINKILLKRIQFERRKKDLPTREKYDTKISDHPLINRKCMFNGKKYLITDVYRSWDWGWKIMIKLQIIDSESGMIIIPYSNISSCCATNFYANEIEFI